MAIEPKTEPGSPLRSFSTTHKRNYNEMSISELVSILRVAIQIEDFDEVEEELMNREAKLKAEIGLLRERIEMEKLNSIEAEEGLKMIQKQCEKGKRAQENYEQLLKELKKYNLVEKNTIEEFRKNNHALEREVCELKEFKKKSLNDRKCVAALWTKIRMLEQQKVGEKVGDKTALDTLDTKNIELEESVKKNLTIIHGLRTENGKLTHKKDERDTLFKSLERKYSELRVRVVKLEDDIKLLMSEDASNCGNTKVEPNPGVSFAVKDEEDVGDYELEDDTGEHVPFQRNEGTHPSLHTGIARSPNKGNKDALGASGVKLNLEKEIIDLVDDDDAVCTSQGLHGKKTISPITAENERSQRVETIKRKRVSDIQTSMSTSIPLSDLFETDEPHVKRSKTSSARFFLNRE